MPRDQGVAERPTRYEIVPNSRALSLVSLFLLKLRIAQIVFEVKTHKFFVPRRIAGITPRYFFSRYILDHAM